MSQFFTLGGHSVGSFSFSISPSNEYLELISFRMDWFDLLAVQGILKRLLQHHSSKASILHHSTFFLVQLSHPYMITGKIRRPGFNPWVGKIPWRRAWQPTPLFLPGESPWTEGPGGLQSWGQKTPSTLRKEDPTAPAPVPGGLMSGPSERPWLSLSNMTSVKRLFHPFFQSASFLFPFL